ncbi:MAG: hypothetical protein HQK58_14230 [Deltaproteobacteria bacterium]|nr:hypothetical protein [Deltaproteobacteria bacterium]
MSVTGNSAPGSKGFFCRLAFVSIILSICLVISGCAALNKDSNGSSSSSSDKSEKSSTVSSQSRYYEFEDVQVPIDMKLDNDKSFVFDAPSFKVGVLSFKGQVTSDSLASYFVTSMSKDNWVLRCKFKYPRRILVFEKVQKMCIINVWDDMFYTYLEIWVAPTMDDVKGSKR